jgi:putative SbcD/Mre11-related phosphoesterase
MRGIMGSIESIRFVYNEPALVVNDNGRNVLVVGDLHIGAEARLADKGIHVYGTSAEMAKHIIGTANEFSAKGVVLLGDVKESVLYPPVSERRAIAAFFGALGALDVEVVAGNHDAHLGEIAGIEPLRELVLGDVALIHGHTWPSEKAVECRYIVTAHNHIAVTVRDSNGALYREKAWLIAPVARAKAKERYGRFKPSRLVVMPAYNDLILGMPVNELGSKGENINPLLRNGIFSHDRAYVYTLRGEYMGTVKELRKAKSLIP